MKEIKLPHQHHSAEKNRAILEKIPDEETILAVADAMKHLGDPTRLRIFWLLWCRCPRRRYRIIFGF